MLAQFAVLASTVLLQNPDSTLLRADSARAACTAAADHKREPDAERAARTATVLYRAAARARPRDPEPLVGEARILSQCVMPFASSLRKGGLYERAVELVERALGLDSTHWAARYTLALNHYHAPALLGRQDEAIRQFEILLAQQGDATDFDEQAAPYVYLGDLYRRAGREVDAQRVWERGARLFPTDERLRRRHGRAGGPTPRTGAPDSSRFDYLVREDFFAGLAGDTVAFARALRRIDETLAGNPRHAEALVWHGSSLIHRAGSAFDRGDMAGGHELWQRGMAEMDSAVMLQPDNVGVLIPRAATLLAAAREWPDPVEARLWLAQAAADYEEVLRLQAPYFRHLPVHARCELLAGTAEARHLLADTVRARDYYRRITTECAGTGYAAQAAAWLEGRQVGRTGTCQGCHRRPE